MSDDTKINIRGEIAKEIIRRWKCPEIRERYGNDIGRLEAELNRVVPMEVFRPFAPIRATVIDFSRRKA